MRICALVTCGVACWVENMADQDKRDLTRVTEIVPGISCGLIRN